MIVLAKLAGALLYPLNLALLVGLTAVLLRRRPRLAGALAAFALAWLWLWSTPWLAQHAARSLEHGHPPALPTDLPAADLIVLLGGLSDPATPPARPDPDLNAAADRAWFAARLWHAGRAPVILCSGGRAPLSGASDPECPGVVRLLVDFGVPEAAIAVEPASRTTRENATETAAAVDRLLGEGRIPGRRLLLVTSARHLPRALVAFDRAGLDAIPAATDHAGRPGRPFALADLLPNPGALALSTSVWHEWLGRVWYALWRGS
ncbi:MAG: YdcF family protein [Xanthomonadales bacterium]|nr:YdcF family protein [Xanthomonadales bacterium]